MPSVMVASVPVSRLFPWYVSRCPMQIPYRKDAVSDARLQGNSFFSRKSTYQGTRLGVGKGEDRASRKWILRAVADLMFRGSLFLYRYWSGRWQGVRV